MVVKRIGPVSLGKMMGALCGAMGLIFGCFFALLSLVGAGLASAAQGESNFLGVFFGVGAIIILPVFYGAIGFISGLINAFLYNLFAGLVGGITLDVE